MKLDDKTKEILEYILDGLYGLFLFMFFIFLPPYLNMTDSDNHTSFWVIETIIFSWIVWFTYFRK